MRHGRSLRLSARALGAQRRRAALAVASVALGVGAVLVTTGLGQGARNEVMRDVSKMGTNLLVVRPRRVERRVARPEIRGRVTTLRPDDCAEIAALPEVRAAATGRDAAMRIKAGRGSMNALVLGAGPSFASLRGLRLRSGRFFRPFEDDASLRVAVLGARIADTLFPGTDPIGATIRVRGLPFEVVGVLESRGVLADGSDEDGNVFIPTRTMLRRVLNSTWITAVFVGATDAGEMEAAENAVRRVLRERHRLGRLDPDDFEVQSQAKLLAVRGSVAASLSLLAGGLAGASLLVGGTGILALMLLSVKERTSEIGLRMAVGARPRDIFVQFLAEASVLSAAGWIGGALVATAALVVLAALTEWPVGVPVAGGVATVLTTIVIGVGFGTFPARRAARLPPIRAVGADR